MAGKQTSALIFFCNGKKIEENKADPECSLATYIRKKLGLTGTKVGCGQGGCGSCTVMLSSYCHVTRQIRHAAVNACLVPVCAVHGLSVTTVEALGSVDTGLHPVQERIAKFHGTQCGFCTPGMVMSMYTLLRNNPKPSQLDVENVLQGNLCRCTGYRPILQAFNTFTEEFKCPMGENCCQNKQEIVFEEPLKVKVLADVVNDMRPYDPSQELIFPSELQLNDTYNKEHLCFHGDRVTWYRPADLKEYLRLRKEFPQARIIAGNTGLGLSNWYNPGNNGAVIYVRNIAELTQHTFSEGLLTLGACLTLNEVNAILKDIIDTRQEGKTRRFQALHSMIQRFSGEQIRNVVSLGGNVANPTPALDINTVLAGAGASVTVLHDDGNTQQYKMDEHFFQGFRKTPLQPTDLVLSVHISLSQKEEHIFSFKQGRKKNNDAAIVNACFRLELSKSNTIKKIVLVYGGVADRTLLAKETASILKDKSWDDNIITVATESLSKEIQIATGSPGGKEEYRRTLIASLFHKFYLAVQMQLTNKNYKDIVELYPREPTRGSQVIVEVPAGQDINDPIGRPIEHVSAFKHATGEARYIDDIPQFENELHMALVLSSRAHAHIVRLDGSAALAMDGVKALYTYKDGDPEYFARDGDEKMFVKDEVESEGQVIAAVVAISHDLAQRAARQVVVEYEDKPAIITLEEAIEARSFLSEEIKLPCDLTAAGMKEADRVLEGEVRIGGQKHFYLEPQQCVVVPRGEDNALDVYSSTQWPHFIQMSLAAALGVSANKIEVHSRRLGGAFGGKGEPAIIPAAPAAFAALKLKRPIRCVLSRDDDMIAIGARHTVLAKYKVGCKNDGRITAVDYQFFSNGGHHISITPMLLQLTMVYGDNAYKLNNVTATGIPLKTNTPSNTTCRSSGSAQGIFFAENILHHVATELGLDPVKVREMHLYKEGDITHYGQTLENVTVGRCWDEVKASADVENRQKLVNTFNKENKWRKRGLAMVPVKYGIGFPAHMICQAGALIQVYMDGSVLVSHAGTEFGQGLNTKIIQVVSRALGIPVSQIHINEASTSMVPNASPTGGSTNTDLYGGALLNACQTLNERLKPVKDKNPSGTWLEWITAAYVERISLSVCGFYSIDGIKDMDWSTGRGSPFPYYTYGAACSEVEIDVLTGAHTILRTDMVIDVGESLNPAIDIGQIEGAFTMGVGLTVYEERLYSQDGRILTRGPINYKIPGVTDIPAVFNVSILKGASNPKAVYSSKGIGEPPMHCAQSVFFAIKEAIRATRIQNGLGSGHFPLNSPATSEAIRLSCGDAYVEKSMKQNDSSKKPWGVLI